MGVPIAMQANRFARLSRRWIAGVIFVVGVAIVAGLGARPTVAPGSSPGGPSDAGLYQAIVERVRGGEPYEHAAVSELRAGHYPLRPFVVVRPPALTLFLASTPDPRVVHLIEAMLGASVIFAWVIRLRELGPGPPWMLWTAICLFTGVGVAMAGGVTSQFSEVWAGLLIALSLAARTERRFAAAVLVGLLAALVRELAVPYLMAMLVFALLERRRGEALAFALAIAVVGVALAWHAHEVMAAVTPADRASHGWVGLGGLAFILTVVSWNLIVPLAGQWAGAAVAPLALVGAGWWKSPTGGRLLLILGGYLAAFLVLGRPDNDYWGFMIAPLLAVGLSLSPLALATLVRRAVRTATPV